MSETPSTKPPGAGSPFHRAPPSRRRPVWRTWLWVAAAVAVALAIAWVLTPHGAPASESGGRGGGGRGGAGAGGAGRTGRRPPTVVGVATAALGDIPIEINELGSVTPLSVVTVHTQITGRLMAIYYKEGQLVHAGQLLALVDDRPYQASLLQAEGQLQRDQAALDIARIDLARYQVLAAQDSIARQTVEDQQGTVRQDEGTVKADQGTIATDKLNITYCHIVAPVSGRVGVMQADPGNIVQITDANGVVIINQVDPTTVEFAIPEDYIPQISARMASAKTLPATALDRSGTTTLAKGELYTLDNQISASTGTVIGRARFSNASGVLFPNQFVNVNVLVDTDRNVVTIPAVAIRHGPQGDFVYVIQPDSTVKVTLVKVGPSQGETASITSGVQVGDRLVTEGGDRLSDGSRVILPENAARFAAMANRKPKPTGLAGWLQGLFGHKPAQDAEAAGGGEGSAAGGHGGGGGGAGRTQAMLASLGLSADQQAKADQLFAAAREKAQGSDDPDARRAAMHDAMAQLEAILTPAQKAKLAELRAARPAGGGGNSGRAGDTSSSGAATAAPPAPMADAGASAAITAPEATSAHHGGGGDHGGDRLAALTGQLGLDADQQAKARAIFDVARGKAQASDDPDARRAAMHDAMTQFATILRPDQKAKLDAIRAARAQGSTGGGGQ